MKEIVAEIRKTNKAIAKFMGYTFYHQGIDIDDSDCGGIYTRIEVFSKIPILVNEYPDADQYYFKDVPNPDYRVENSKRWRNDKEFLGWNTLNYDQYITELNYHCSWNELMHVVKKIEDLGFEVQIKTNLTIISGNGFSEKFYHEDKLPITYKAITAFINWYNTNKTQGAEGGI